MSWSINTEKLNSHWCDGQFRVEVQKNDGPTNSIDVSSEKNPTKLNGFFQSPTPGRGPPGSLQPFAGPWYRATV